MDLITVSEMDELPDDPAIAFVQLERICRVRLHEYTSKQERYDEGSDLRLEYMTIIASAAESYGVADFREPEEGWDSRSFQTVYQRAISIATKLAIESKRARALSSVALPIAAKERLRRHLEELRDALDKVSFDDKRKKVLRQKLDGFEKEIDREKSNINIMLVSVALIAAALKQGTDTVTGIEDALIKIPETVNAVNVLLGREKLKELEAVPDLLPLPPSVTKALPAPQSKLSTGNFSDNVDDDVSF